MNYNFMYKLISSVSFTNHPVFARINKKITHFTINHYALEERACQFTPHLNIRTFAGNDAARGTAHVTSSDTADLLYHHWLRHFFFLEEIRSATKILIKAQHKLFCACAMYIVHVTGFVCVVSS